MSRVTIYHNPRCLTSRKTLELIRAKGIEPAIIEYLKTPPSTVELEKILALLAMEPRELMRKKEEAYRTRRLEDPSLSRRQLIQAMVDEPILIERPIVLSRGKAALGRPPERVEAIL
jgi:arsenate reductase